MTVARILVVLGVLLMIVSLVAGFVRFQGLDTDTVEGSASELIADKEIRDQIAASLVDELYTRVDIAEVLEEGLPPEQQGLAGPAAAGLRELSDRAAVRMLERPRVQALWVESVTRAHRQLINVLDDSDEALLSTEGGEIYLDLQPLMIQLGERVAVFGEVANRLGPDAGRIEIMETSELETAQDLTKILKFLGMWLWILPVALWVGALVLARGRRRSILRMIALGSILAGLVVLVIRRLAGDAVIEELVASASAEPAAQKAWDILTTLLRDGGLTLVGLGVIMLVRRLADRPVVERRRLAARARSLPGPARDRLRRRRGALPAPPLVEPDRADDEGAADPRRRDHPRGRRRAPAAADRPRGRRSRFARPRRVDPPEPGARTGVVGRPGSRHDAGAPAAAPRGGSGDRRGVRGREGSANAPVGPSGPRS